MYDIVIDGKNIEVPVTFYKKSPGSAYKVYRYRFKLVRYPHKYSAVLKAYADLVVRLRDENGVSLFYGHNVSTTLSYINITTENNGNADILLFNNGEYLRAKVTPTDPEMAYVEVLYNIVSHINDDEL